MSRCGSHNKYSKMAITNNFVPWKHGHIVAKELSRAQLCRQTTNVIWVRRSAAVSQLSIGLLLALYNCLWPDPTVLSVTHKTYKGKFCCWPSQNQLLLKKIRFKIQNSIGWIHIWWSSGSGSTFISEIRIRIQVLKNQHKKWVNYWIFMATLVIQ